MSRKKLHPGYKALLTEVLPKLKGFQSDIEVHDKAMLTGYKGNFILGYRDNGTNLYRIDSMLDSVNWGKQNLRESLIANKKCSCTFLTNNKNFLFVGSDGVSREITKENAVDFLETRTKAASEIIDFLERIDLKQIAFELMTFIKYNGRYWKARLKNEWESYNQSASLRRLRNYFEHSDIFKNITVDDNEESIFSKLSTSYVSNIDNEDI